MPRAGTGHLSRANAHFDWAVRYNDRRNELKASAHLGRALSYLQSYRGTRFGADVRVTNEDGKTIEFEQGAAVVNFGDAKLFTYNLVNCIAIGGSFAYEEGGEQKKGAFFTHEAPTEYEGHQLTLSSIASTLDVKGARVVAVVLFHSARPSGDVYKGRMTVPAIVRSMEEFCGRIFKTTVSVEKYEQADLSDISRFFVGTASVWPGGHAVGKASLRASPRRAEPSRAPTGTFIVDVRKSEHGDKVYFCPECKRLTGTYAVQHPSDPGSFGHLYIESPDGSSYKCPNDGKVPVERKLT